MGAASNEKVGKDQDEGLGFLIRILPSLHRHQRLCALVLFILTLCTTTLAQLPMLSGGRGVWVDLWKTLSDPGRLHFALSFSVPLMLILSVHELGHIWAGKAQGHRLSNPFFVPAPTFFGTLGAIITMSDTPIKRSTLIRIACAGPLTGLCVAIGACVWGLSHSPTFTTTSVTQQEMALGTSIFFDLMMQWLGINATTVVLHPTAFAGWVGLFLTSLNLLPAGQLDGGHIAFGLLGEKQRWLSRLSIVSLIALASILTWTTYTNGQGVGSLVWGIWALILLTLGLSPAISLSSMKGPGFGNSVLGGTTLIFFVLTFVPTPFVLTDHQGTSPSFERTHDRPRLLMPYYVPIAPRQTPSTKTEAQEFRL
jgi:membrane-associated protease RseP (regulator of RpoE activity)